MMPIAPLLMLSMSLATAATTDGDPSRPSRIPEVHETSRAITAGVLETRARLDREAEAAAVAKVPVAPWQQVRAKANGVEVASVGLLLVGGVTWAIGQIELDAVKNAPPSASRDAREDLGYTLNVGGLGALVAGATLWFLSAELANWQPEVPVSAVVTPTEGGANLSVGVRFP